MVVYTGFIFRTPSDRRFGFEFVIFQTIRGTNPIGYLSHLAITDEAANRFTYDARSSVRPSVPNQLDLDVDAWTLAGGDGNDHIAATMSDYALDLDITTEKPAGCTTAGSSPLSHPALILLLKDADDGNRAHAGG